MSVSISRSHRKEKDKNITCEPEPARPIIVPLVGWLALLRKPCPTLRDSLTFVNRIQAKYRSDVSRHGEDVWRSPGTRSWRIRCADGLATETFGCIRHLGCQQLGEMERYAPTQGLVGLEVNSDKRHATGTIDAPTRTGS